MIVNDNEGLTIDGCIGINPDDYKKPIATTNFDFTLTFTDEGAQDVAQFLSAGEHECKTIVSADHKTVIFRVKVSV